MTAGQTRKSLEKIHDDVEFYPHQLEGIRSLARMGSFMLCDEMGLGKSIQALTVAAIDFQRGWASRVLIVCPASLKWNWQDECEKHTTFSSVILDGDKNARLKQMQLFDLMNLDVMIVNYEQVVGHLTELNKLNFDIIIYDEAHYIKNYKSKRTKACLKLRGGRHFVLTGSPLLNQVNELWPLLHRVASDEFPKYWTFVNRYAVYGGFQNKQIIGVKNRPELNSAVDRLMVRRLKKDVLDLPEKMYIPLYVELSPLQRELYDSAYDDLSIDLPDSPNPIEIENALTKYLYLKQICGTAAEIDGYPDESAKLDRAMELIAEITHDEPDSPGEPVVVFTQFRKTQACLAERVEKAGIKCFVLNGDVKMDQRAEIIKLWSDYRGKDGRPAVLCGMVQVASVGLNMTAASRAIFIDRLYVPKLNEQAEDRIHRIGADKTRPIQIYTIIARKTIEQRIEAILSRKRKLFDSLIEESDWKKALYEALSAEDD